MMKRVSIGVAGVLTFSYLQMVPAAQSQEYYSTAGTTVLEKIVVSVRKRDEIVQETPASVTVAEDGDLGNGKINTLEDFAKASPNTIFNPQSGPITIRGVGSVGIDGGLDRQLGVGIFVDEVYVGRAAGIPNYLDDLQRIEVVRGSQSTLYGKNTIAGAINMISREPGDEFSFSTGVSLGTLSYRRFTAALDAPLADGAVLTRSFFTYTARDGYVANSTNNYDEADIDSIGGRFSAIGYLSDATTVKLTMDYEKSKSDGGIPYVPVDLPFSLNLIWILNLRAMLGAAVLRSRSSMIRVAPISHQFPRTEPMIRTSFLTVISQHSISLDRPVLKNSGRLVRNSGCHPTIGKAKPNRAICAG